jgi:hypothetical protein
LLRNGWQVYVAAMHTIPASLLGAILLASIATQPVQPAGAQRIDLAAQLAAGKLKTVNRDVTPTPGRAAAVHLSEREVVGVAWIDGSDLADGTIEVEIRGRDVLQKSFVGIAFHRKTDDNYEAVYLRPFNFRAADPVRHQHAIQYIAAPDFDWPRLRQEFPEEFEEPVDPSISPTDWVPVRIVIKGDRVQVFAGTATKPTLDVRKLGRLDGGMVGLWVGNNSDGDFANLRVTPAR